MLVTEVAYLRLKATGFQRIKPYAEGDSEASKSPRPKARFSQIGHGGGKRNHALRGAKVTVKQISAVSNARKSKSKNSRKNSVPGFAEVLRQGHRAPRLCPQNSTCFVRVAQMGMPTSCDRICLRNASSWTVHGGFELHHQRQKLQRISCRIRPKNAVNKGQTY